MKSLFLLFIATIGTLTACSQDKSPPVKFEFKGVKIGDKVDTSQYNKYADGYFPNYLDGWNMENADALTQKYKGLPIAIWQSKRDSSIVLTLLNNVVFNVTISYLSDQEKQQISQMITQKLSMAGVHRSYEETHPLQSYITYWDLTTWENSNVIVQIGNGILKMPSDPKPAKQTWNLVYSDLSQERKIISDYNSNH